MPNRYTRESAIESEPVNSLSWQGEVFWRRLINRVDDFGRISADPRILRARIFPLQLNKVTERDVARLLVENEEAGLLFTYKVDGKFYLVMNKWEQGRAKVSAYPPPPPEVCERMQTYVYKREHMSLTPTPTPTPTRGKAPPVFPDRKARIIKDQIEQLKKRGVNGVVRESDKPVLKQLKQALKEAEAAVTGVEIPDLVPSVEPSKNPKPTPVVDHAELARKAKEFAEQARKAVQ